MSCYASKKMSLDFLDSLASFGQIALLQKCHNQAEAAEAAYESGTSLFWMTWAKRFDHHNGFVFAVSALLQSLTPIPFPCWEGEPEK